MNQPHLLNIYNSNMGGVDLLDNLFSIRSRKRKWYRCWGFYNGFLNVSMVQAGRLYRKVGAVKKVKDNEKISLLDFTPLCAEMTVMMHGNDVVSSLPSIHAIANRDDIRKGQGNHLIIKTDEKGVYKFDFNRTSYRCRRCDVDYIQIALNLITAEACYQICEWFLLCLNFRFFVAS